MNNADYWMPPIPNFPKPDVDTILYKIETDDHFVKFYYRKRLPSQRNPHCEYSNMIVIMKEYLNHL